MKPTSKTFKPRTILAASLVMMVGVFVADIQMPLGVAIGVAYVAVVLFSFWSYWRYYTVIISLVATVLTLFGHFLSPIGGLIWLDLVNRLMALFAIWVTAILFLRWKGSEKALNEAQALYNLAVSGANDGLWVWNINENSIYFSPRWKAIFGWTESDIGIEPEEWFKRVHPQDIQALQYEIKEHLEKRKEHFEHEHRMLHKDGDYRWVNARGLAGWDEEGKAVRLAGSLSDITLRKQKEEQYRVLTIHDQLTGVFNRRHFMERFENEVRSAQRYRYPLALGICDIDNFKHINDTYGHRAGDKVLRRFGRLLSNLLRTENVAGRIGGDEFCILFPHAICESAAISLERIRSHFERIVFQAKNGETFSTSATFGIAEIQNSNEDEMDLIESADQALYQAKNLGRNRIVVHDSTQQLYLFEP